MRLKHAEAGHVNAGDLVADVDGIAVPWHAWPGAAENTEEARVSFAAACVGANVVPWVAGAVIPGRRADEPLEINTGTFEARISAGSVKGVLLELNLSTGVLEPTENPALALCKCKEVLGFRSKALVSMIRKKG